MRDFFHPVGAILLDLLGPFERVVLIPAAEGVEHDFVIFAEGFAEGFDELDVLAHSLLPGAGAVTHKPLLIAEALVLEREATLANGFKLE